MEGSLFGQAPKQTCMQGAGFALGFFKLLVGGVSDTGTFPVRAHFRSLRLGPLRRRNALGFFGGFFFHNPTFHSIWSHET
jgi:hypothetical protein